MKIIVKPKGRIDSSSANNFTTLISDAINNNKDFTELEIDFALVEYISSAGLRVLLSTQKTINSLSKSLIVSNVSKDIYEVFDISGFLTILNIKKAIRQISIDNAVLIGSGMCGECYRLDEDTILKLYFENTSHDMIEKELKYAKAAFLLGIPTAISFDLVQCQKRQGVIFEMLKADSLAMLCKKHPENIPLYASQFAKLAKNIHSINANKDVFPSCTKHFEKYIDMQTYLSKQEIEQIHNIFNSLPVSDTCIHGDFHPGNIMSQNDELLFIDMGDFGYGHPYWDIAQVYNIYARTDQDSLAESISKLNSENRKIFWDTFLTSYFTTEELLHKTELLNTIKTFCAMRNLFFISEFEATAKTNIEFIRSCFFN